MINIIIHKNINFIMDYLEVILGKHHQTRTFCNKVPVFNFKIKLNYDIIIILR